MASPIPPDPYAALGLPKDTDLSAIRTAHRKLALKYHPDRIKDESQRERGKDEFQKIQQAYELLSDPVRRSRYDDRIRLAELRKEAMMRDPQPTPAAPPRAYPMRPAPQPTPTAAREFREDRGFFEEVRQPRDAPSYDYRDPYDEPSPRTTTRKHAEYEKRPAPPQAKSAEKAKKAPSVFSVAHAAVKLKNAAEKARGSKADEKRSDREKKRDRSEKVGRGTAYVQSDSESDVPEIRPSSKHASRPKTVPRYEPTSDIPPRSTFRTERVADSDEESFDPKWERHHAESKAYISKATNRPSLDRGGSDAYQYWGPKDGSGRRSGSDNEKRPSSSKGRRPHTTDDYFAQPPLPKSNSSPSHLRAHLEERVPAGVGRDRERERDRDRDRDRERDRDPRDRDPRDHRKMMPQTPGLHRSQTTPVAKSSSRKDNAPSKPSNLKHGESHMHDSGYSSSPLTPEMREESPPPARPKARHTTSSTKYQVVDEDHSGEDSNRTPRLNKIHDDHDDRYANRRIHHSPETIIREPLPRESDRRKDNTDRLRVETNSRSKSSRGASLMQNLVQPTQPRRSESGRFDDRGSPRSPRETPNISRNNSERANMSPDEREPSRYTRPYSADKLNMSARRDASSAQYSSYPREPAEYRDHDGPRFRDARMRRPSLSVGGY